MTQSHSPAFLHRLVGVPKRLFTKTPPRPTSAQKRATAASEVVFRSQQRLRLSPAPDAKPQKPEPAARPATVGALALKRPWPQPERENLFRDDFDI